MILYKARKTGQIVGLFLMAICFSYGYATTFPGMPSGLDDYIRTSDIIVIGRIGEVLKVHTFYGYQESAAELEERDASSPISLGLPMVDYEILVEEVIETDGYYTGTDTQPLTLRVVRSSDDISSESTIGQDSGLFVFFLSRNPDDETYGFYTFAHKVRIEERDGQPKYYFEGELYDVLSGSFNSDELVSAIRQEF